MPQRPKTAACLALCGVLAIACSSTTPGAKPAPPSSTSALSHPTQRGYFVYWDQNEEEDYQAASSGQQGQLIPPWDPNGQLCLAPDGSGKFSVGYNPTLPSQHNPGSLKPPKQPPVGEALYDQHGQFTGHTSFVPGPFSMSSQTVGGDIPPDSNSPSHAFNNNGTFVGCAFDGRGDLFATDLGTAQGQFPAPDDGRLIEWFGPQLTSYCILYGPTSGGVGPHHVTGTGGLRQPSELAFDANGDLLLPEAGATQNGLPGGRVLRFDHTAFPQGPADCGADGVYPRDKIRTSTFFQGSLSLLPFPLAIARDPTCSCWAIDSVFGDPAVAFFDDQGHQLPAHGVIHGQTIAQLGKDPAGYNPFGLAVAPDGTVYFVDIQIACQNNSLGNCGPVSKGGRVMKVTFTAGQPGVPVPIATGIDFPTSVTVCVPTLHQYCPLPSGITG